MKKLIIMLLALLAVPAAWSALTISRVDNSGAEFTVITLVDTAPTTSLDIDGAVIILPDTAAKKIQARGVKTAVTYDSAVVKLSFPHTDTLTGAVLSLGVNGQTMTLSL